MSGLCELDWHRSWTDELWLGIVDGGLDVV
jgi:hypothetical protein